MTTASTSNPVIPAPTGWCIVQGSVYRMLSVPLDAVHVVYAYDTASITLSLVEGSHQPRASDLDKAVRDREPPGRVVVRVPEIECGGVLSEYWPPVVTGTATDVDLALHAIPHVYTCLREPDERRTVRALYRWLTKHQTATTTGEGTGQ